MTKSQFQVLYLTFIIKISNTHKNRQNSIMKYQIPVTQIQQLSTFSPCYCFYFHLLYKHIQRITMYIYIYIVFIYIDSHRLCFFYQLISINKFYSPFHFQMWPDLDKFCGHLTYRQHYWFETLKKNGCTSSYSLLLSAVWFFHALPCTSRVESLGTRVQRFPC